MSKDDMEEYLAEIDRLKKKYKDQLEIYTALEIDYLDETYNPSIPYFLELPLDYRIGSVHFLPLSRTLAPDQMVTIDGSYAEFEKAIDQHFGGRIENLVRQYFESSLQMVNQGGIDIVGHLDKVYMNGSRHPDFDFEANWYQQSFNELLDLIAEKGLMVEINTKNLKRKNQTFPRKEYIGRLLARKIPILINSDCHFPDLVNDGREEAFNWVKEAGYKYTRELIRGQWQDVAID